MGPLLFLTLRLHKWPARAHPVRGTAICRWLPAIPENNQYNGCRETATRPKIASGFGTIVADRIPPTEMHSDPHRQQEATNKVVITWPYPWRSQKC
jgi:hypothetical protein